MSSIDVASEATPTAPQRLAQRLGRFRFGNIEFDTLSRTGRLVTIFSRTYCTASACSVAPVAIPVRCGVLDVSVGVNSKG